jgi:hypothetical protein
MTLTVTLPDGTTASPGFTNPTTGRYVPGVYVPATAGHYVVRWLGTGLNSAAYTETFDVTDVVSLVNLAEMKATLDIPVSSTEFDEELRTYIGAATALVEEIVGGPVADRAVTETPVRASGGALILRTAHPISITSITSIVGGTTTDVTSTWLDANAGIVYLRSGSWWAGPYTVVLRAGLGGVPPAVGLAAKVIVQHIWETQHAPALAPGPLGNETPQPFLGAFSVPNRAKELLSPYATVAVVA